MKLSVLLIILLLSGSGYSQSNFYKQYSSNGYDFGQGIVELPDSSYVITGASSGFQDGPSQMFLLKLDSLGDYVWSHHYGGSETDWGRRVKHIANDGFFVGGYTNSSGNGAYDFALWKISENGTEEWFNTYGTSGWERMHDMALTADNGLILVGETNNTADGLTDIYIVRIDYNGTVLWEEQIENPGNDNALTIQMFDDSTFIIGGYFYNNLTNFKQAWLTRIQDDGTQLWNHISGDNYHYEIADLEIDLSSQKIYGVGGKINASLDQSQLYVLITDASGAIIHTTTQNNNKEAGVGITTHNSSGRFAVCTSNSGEFSYGKEDLFFFSFTYNGDYFSTLGTVQYISTQVLGEIITTYNNGAIAVGYNEDIGPGGSSIFAIRMGKDQPYISSNDDFSTNPLVSIETVGNNLKIVVYPNPASDQLTISSFSGSSSDIAISLIDVVGKEILTTKASSLQETRVDINTVSTGIYVLVIRNSAQEIIYNQKIEVK